MNNLRQTGKKEYLALRQLANQQGRPTDALLTMYALEGFLNRLAHSPYREQMILKGGMLLAYFENRRPTKDVDLQAQDFPNDEAAVRDLVTDVASTSIADGLDFDTAKVTSEIIREGDEYSGIRVSLDVHLHTARLRLKVDVNVGDPIEPAPQEIDYPRLLEEATISLRGYPLEMVYAEKISTAVARGTANTRWRDFADVYRLSRSRECSADELRAAIDTVTSYRQVALAPLADVLEGFGVSGQAKWSAWRRKNQMEEAVPEDFEQALEAVARFADPIITGLVRGSAWDPTAHRWN